MRQLRMSKVASIPLYRHNTDGPTSVVGESADALTKSPNSKIEDLFEDVVVKNIPKFNERANYANESPLRLQAQAYSLDKEEYLNAELNKIEPSSGTPSVLSRDLLYYNQHPIELVRPKSIQNVDMDDDIPSLNFPIRLDRVQSPHTARM